MPDEPAGLREDATLSPLDVRCTELHGAGGVEEPAVTRFQPPADGLLTDAQLGRYARVRRAASRGRSDGDSARAVGVACAGARAGCCAPRQAGTSQYARRLYVYSQGRS